MKYVEELNGLEDNPISLLGGKAFNLNRLISMGEKVPPGFIVKTNAYRTFTKQRKMNNAIKNIIEDSKIKNLEKLQSRTENLRKLFIEHLIPKTILDEIKSSYYELIKKEDLSSQVSVRSSATSEDLAEASFAGLHSTFLNVSGLDEVLSSIKGCWASLWSPGAVVYRERCGFDHSRVAMAVIIQQMVPADWSGVIFTSNPVSANRNEVVINSVKGLGEKLVSGQTTPNIYITNKVTQETVRKNTGFNHCNDLLYENQSTQNPFGNDDNSLTEHQIRGLVETALRIEKSYGEPQDIEWAIISDEIHVLQSRPIFTLLSRHDIWLQRSPAQISIEKPVIEQRLQKKNSRTEADKEAERKSRYLKAQKLNSDWHSKILPNLIEEVDRYKKIDYAYLSDNDLASILRDVVSSNRGHFKLRISVGGLIDSSIDELELYLGGFEVISSEKIPMLLIGSMNKDVESDMALSGLASQTTDGILDILRRGPESLHELEKVEGGGRWIRGFRSYLDSFGHLSSAKWDVMAPTYSEDPGFILNTIISYASHGNGQKNYLAIADERDAQIRKILDTLPAGEKKSFFQVLELAQKNYPLKDDRDFYYLMSLAQVRRALLEAGCRLRERGVIGSVDDVFFLETEEVHDLIKGQLEDVEAVRARIKSRKLIFNERAQTQNEWALESSKLDHLSHEDGTLVLNGLGISPGVSTGRARIVRSFHEFPKIEMGDILVSPAASPAWAPILGIAKGIVTDVGGALSHGGILAREYGIPAVVSTSIGTSVIKEGQLITVDGSRGRVYLHQPEGGGEH